MKPASQRAREYRQRRREELIAAQLRKSDAPDPIPSTLPPDLVESIATRVATKLREQNQQLTKAEDDPVPVGTDSDFYYPPPDNVQDANSRIPAWSATFTVETGMVVDPNGDGGRGRSHTWSESAEEEALERAQQERFREEDARRQFLLPDYLRRHPNAD